MFRHHKAADERSGSAGKRLSDRFGIPEREVNDLLYGRQQQAADTNPLPKGELRMPTPTPDSHRWGPASVLGALLGIAGILSLVTLMMVIFHHHREMDRADRVYMPPPVMQPPPEALPQPSPGSPAIVPSPNPQASEPSSPSVDQGKDVQTTPKKKVHHQSKGYSTTSNMDAEEHLAELRADGNKHAQIRSSKKNGVITYDVR
jgi:hypothetical protein